METEAVLAGLEAVRREAIRRESGEDPPDPRFDLAFDVLADLADALHEHSYPLSTGVCSCGAEHPELGPAKP